MFAASCHTLVAEPDFPRFLSSTEEPVDCVEFGVQKKDAKNAHVQALIRAMSSYSAAEIEALEDEIDFFTFTGLKRQLTQEVLHKASSDSIEF